MASLEKLSILGIRSFGPQNEQSLTFEKPLTLILGDNGCGKSTIIECLRYVTAQKEPSGKGVFIHDPNLTSNSTVKAYVKLTLKDARGREVGLSKNSQSTRTRIGITTKTLDSAISYWPAGEKKPISTSSRCADFTPEIMQILGVSKAILENVIFCTQEDAHWPLDTDQKLKEKFDQIFDSDKYNKCLKKVKDQRKTLITETKMRTIELKHLKEKNQHASLVRKDLQTKENEIESLKNELEDLETSLVPVKTKLQEIDQQERKLSKLHRERESKVSEIQLVEKTENELREKIKKAASEFIGTDTDLEQALLNCDVETINENDLKRELAQTKVNEDKVSRDMSKNLALVGQISKSIEIKEQKCEEKEKLLVDLASKCNIEDSNVSLENVSQAIDRVKDKFSRTVQDHETEEEKLQVQVNETRDELMNLKSELRQKTVNLDEAVKEKNDISKELENLEASQARRQEISDEMKKINRSLDAHLKATNVEELKKDLTVCQSSLKEFETSLTAAEDDLKVLRGQSETGSKLNLKREEMNRKTSESTKLMNAHQNTLVDILGSIPKFGFARTVQSRSQQLAEDVRELRNKKTALEEEITTCKNRVLSIGDLLKKKRNDLQSYTDQVNSQTGGDELDETVSNAEFTLNDYQNEKGTLSSSKAIFEKFIKDLDSKPCCPLCKRDFDKENESLMLKDELTHEIRNAPSKLEKLNQSVLESQSKLRVLLPLKAQQDSMSKLENEEIPALSKEETETKLSISMKRKELEDIKERIGKNEKALQVCHSILGDMAILDQVTSDISKIEKETEHFASLLPENWNRNSLETAELLREKLHSKAKNQQEKREEIQRQINDYNTVLCELKHQKTKLSEEELALLGHGSRQKQREDRLIVLKRLIETLRLDIQNYRETIAKLEQVYNNRVLNFKTRKEIHKNVVKENQTELETLIEKLKAIKRLVSDIQSFERSNENEKLSTLKKTIEQQETEIKGFKLQIESINSKLGDLSAIVVRRHELEDNKAMRGKEDEKVRLQLELKEFEASFTELNYRTIEREKQRLKSQEEKICNKKAHHFGKMGEIERQVKDITKDLATRYKDVELVYKKELIELKIAEALATDLLRYGTAMDWAMNEYHKRQMEKVNGIVREYWRKIYRGNDVDYIEIQTGQGSIDKRQIYNYKLIQVKGDVRLDMRNRCSAGQKMLASLIIRMALAEVFSNNCGILTLDEPTTNLDRRNIRNLANTLNELIATKQSLSRTNFQLIVITHDRDFIKELTSVNAVDKYIEVSRDRDGRSQLTIRTADRL